MIKITSNTYAVWLFVLFGAFVGLSSNIYAQSAFKAHPMLLRGNGLTDESIKVYPQKQVIVFRYEAPKTYRKHLMVWNYAKGEVIGDIEIDRNENLYALSPKSKYLAYSTGYSYSQGAYHVYSIEKGSVQHKIKVPFFSCQTMAFSPDGKQLILAGEKGYRHPKKGYISIWDIETAKEVSHIATNTQAISNLALSTDGKKLAAISQDKHLLVYSLFTNKLTYKAKVGGGTAYLKSSLFFYQNNQKLLIPDPTIKTAYSSIDLATKIKTRFVHPNEADHKFHIIPNQTKAVYAHNYRRFLSLNTRKKPKPIPPTIYVTDLSKNTTQKLVVPSDEFPRENIDSNNPFVFVAPINDQQVLFITGKKEASYERQCFVWNYKQGNVTDLQ